VSPIESYAAGLLSVINAENWDYNNVLMVYVQSHLHYVDPYLLVNILMTLNAGTDFASKNSLNVLQLLYPSLQHALH
jgi:hypothetical protein